MANEIVEITRDPLKSGLLRFTVLFLHALAEPVKANGVDVVLTPSHELPPEVDAYKLLGDTEAAAAIKAKLDDGTGWFSVEPFDQRRIMTGIDPETKEPTYRKETPAEVLGRARPRYNNKSAPYIAQQRARYEHAGDTHDAAGG